jgi:putative ABC transport system permease protein
MQHLYTFYSDAFFIAVKSIIEHKLRAFLTLLGVIIGVASVVVVGASISGLNSYVTEQVSKVLGANHFMINRMSHSGEMSDEEYEARNKLNKSISWEEYEYIKAKCTKCSEVGAQDDDRIDINQDGIEMPAVRVQGVTENMEIIEDKTIEYGRFIIKSEVERSANVVVLGYDVMEKFFPHQNPIGQTLKVRGVPLKVIGVEEKRGSMFGEALDRHIYIPITLHFQFFGGGGGIQMHGKSEVREELELAIEDARTNLRNRRKLIGSDEDTFGVVNTAELGSQIDQFTGAIAAVVVPITLITLIIGGIVVMNIMLVSVTERTKEIGIRKALGATKSAIVLQFLLEAMTLTFFGGVLGVLIAIGIAQLIMLIVPTLPASIALWSILLALGVSVAVGLIFGVLPARKAANLDPIECLRYE